MNGGGGGTGASSVTIFPPLVIFWMVNMLFMFGGGGGGGTPTFGGGGGGGTCVCHQYKYHHTFNRIAVCSVSSREDFAPSILFGISYILAFKNIHPSPLSC